MTLTYRLNSWQENLYQLSAEYDYKYIHAFIKFIMNELFDDT